MTARIRPLRLRCSKAALRSALADYDVRADDPAEAVAPAVRKRGFARRNEFLVLCDWKSRRPARRYRENSAGLIEEATRVALGSRQEELKIGVLLLLSGVSWPVASVILHFCDRGKYPILDFRALAALGVDPPPSPYTFTFWMAYTSYTRALSRDTGLSMRQLDRALWQWAKDHE